MTHAEEIDAIWNPELAAALKGEEPGRGRAAQRGGGFAEGEAALAPGGPRDRARQPGSDASARGSGMIVASSGARELSYSGPSSMPRSLASKLNATARPIDQAIGETVDEVTTGAQGYTPRPTQASVGDSGGHEFGSGPTKRGVGVTNGNYEGLGTRPTYATTYPLMRAFEGRGFRFERHSDLNAGAMREAYGAAATTISPGDELVLTYGGHGLPEGLCGVQNRADRPDILPHAELNGMVQKAVDAGAHVRALIFACYAGQGAADMRLSEARRLIRSPKADQHWLQRFRVLRTRSESLQSLSADLLRQEKSAMRAREADIAVRMPGPDKADARRAALDAAGAEARARSAERLAAYWADIRESLVLSAQAISAADGQPPREIPEKLDPHCWDGRDGHSSFVLSAELDCIDDLETRALKLASGPSPDLSAG